MAKILKNQTIVADDWQTLRLSDNDNPATVTIPNGRVLVPFSLWQAQQATLSQRVNEIGVWLSPADDLSLVAKGFSSWPLVAVDFPKFTDGRGYSIAWQLRNDHQYLGELRAIGNVLADQAFFLLRVGFNSLALDAHVNEATALQQLSPFPFTYQGSTDQPEPLFQHVPRSTTGAPV